MPHHDLFTVSPQLVSYVCTSRINVFFSTAWKSQIPWPIVVEFILPYAALSEPRDLSIELLHRLENYLLPLVKQEINHTAQLLNYRAFDFTTPRIEFEAAKPNQVNAYSVAEVVEAKTASCTGESVFLVTCLRTVGIPARIAGVPHWNRGSQLCPLGNRSPLCGNHNWVEVFLGREWAFLDQNTLLALNQAWFFPELTNELDSHSFFHAVYAAGWAGTNSFFPLVFDKWNTEVPGIPRTTYYQHANVTRKLQSPFSTSSVIIM